MSSSHHPFKLLIMSVCSKGKWDAHANKLICFLLLINLLSSQFIGHQEKNLRGEKEEKEKEKEKQQEKEEAKQQ